MKKCFLKIQMRSVSAMNKQELKQLKIEYKYLHCTYNVSSEGTLLQQYCYGHINFVKVLHRLEKKKNSIQ